MIDTPEAVKPLAAFSLGFDPKVVSSGRGYVTVPVSGQGNQALSVYALPNRFPMFPVVSGRIRLFPLVTVEVGGKFPLIKPVCVSFPQTML